MNEWRRVITLLRLFSLGSLYVEVRLLRYVEQNMFHAHAGIADEGLATILAYQNDVVFQQILRMVP